MMTIEENRKKVVRNNILMSLLFCITIIAVIGAAYYYNSVKSSEIKLLTAKQQQQTLNDSLAIHKRKAENQLDTIAKLQRLLNNISQTPNNCDSIFIIQKKINNILRPVTNARDAAREFARSGYDKLIKKDLVGAMNDFDKSEKAYNGYHDSYEVYFLLWQNRNKLNDPKVQQQLLEKIQKDYNSLKKLTPSNIK